MKPAKKRKRKRPQVAAGDLLNIPGFLRRAGEKHSTFERVTSSPRLTPAAPTSAAPTSAAPAHRPPKPGGWAPPAATREGYAAGIAEAYQALIDGSLEVGRRLLAAKEALQHGAFQAMVDADLPFKRRMAEMFMAVARDTRLLNAQRVALLPDSLVARYALTRLDDQILEDAYAKGKVSPAMTRAEAVKLKKDAAAARLKADNVAHVAARPDGETFAGDVGEALQDLAGAGRKFGAVVVDPPWPFDVWSEKGKGRSAEQHYPVMAVDAIAALPVGEVAMDDCALFLWATMPQLPAALRVMAAWGFAYKTAAFVWVKRNPVAGGLWLGMGMWTRANAELVLVGARGAPVRYAQDVPQIVEAPVARHSEKPGEVRDRIMRLVRGEYLEIFARDRCPGWTAIGDQLGGRERSARP